MHIRNCNKIKHRLDHHSTYVEIYLCWSLWQHCSSSSSSSTKHYTRSGNHKEVRGSGWDMIPMRCMCWRMSSIISTACTHTHTLSTRHNSLVYNTCKPLRSACKPDQWPSEALACWWMWVQGCSDWPSVCDELSSPLARNQTTPPTHSYTSNIM